MPEPMLDQYFDLMGACAQGGAQAVGDAALLTQVYLITLSVMLAALIIACWALLGSTSYAERSDDARRWRMWERFRAAWAADEAAESALRLTAQQRAEQRAQQRAQRRTSDERQDQHRMGRRHVVACGGLHPRLEGL